MISETSKQLGVEPHVLRYWEEELDMRIKRNEMGHRYYTEEDIRVLKVVRDMKNQGFQLKAIKQVLVELYENPEFNWTSLLERKDAMNQAAMEQSHPKVVAMQPTYQAQALQPVQGASPQPVQSASLSAELKLEQFQEIMTKIIGKALENNNRSLSGAISNEVSNKVSERVIKQMDYVMRENEEREEERFRRLDEAIRTRQKMNAEAAAALEETKRKKKKKIFGKKSKVKPRVLN
jgi:DNA-binding transcriptional MerR regulator